MTKKFFRSLTGRLLGCTLLAGMLSAAGCSNAGGRDLEYMQQIKATIPSDYVGCSPMVTSAPDACSSGYYKGQDGYCHPTDICYDIAKK